MPRQPVYELTEEEKFVQQLQQEQELQSLQRQYILLERDRHRYGIKLESLNKILAIYKKEHRNILTDLEVASSSVQDRENRKDLKYLSHRLDEYDVCDFEVKLDRQHMIEVEGQIRTVEKAVVKLRSMQTTDRHREERIWSAKKTIEGLMNKLDVQNKKFGVICAKNRNMKTEIGRMIWERDVFMKIWNKLINQLTLGKKFMTDLTEQATIAYDEREQWVSKLQALRIKAHLDFVLHSHEMRTLQVRQDNSTKLEAFFSLKERKRVMKDLQKREEAKRLENKEKLTQRLEQYKTFLDDILEFSKEQEVHVIAKKFHSRECENFSLFNRVTILLEEMEHMADDLAVLQNDITEKTVLRNATNEERQYSLIKMEADLKTATQEVEDAKTELASVEEYLNKMMSGIDSIFKICGCDRDPILQLLNDNTKVNVYNYKFFIQMIENVLHTVIVEEFHNENTAFEKKKITSSQRVIYEDFLRTDYRSAQFGTLTNPCPLCIEHETVSDVIDTVQRVKSRAEAKEALEERLLTPEYVEHLHNLSKCFLPKSRELLQKRYL